MAAPTPPNTNPGTPGFPPEQIAAVTMGGLAVVSQFLPLNAEAKNGIVDVVTIVAPTVAVSGAAVRIGRQKFWGNFFRVDADHDPSTPDTMIPVVFLVALGGIALVAIGLAIAVVVLLL